MTTYATDDEKWAACLARAPAADGAFVVLVATTGIYCRPVCAARPLRRNVRFAATAADAEAQGFRACRRCTLRDGLHLPRKTA